MSKFNLPTTRPEIMYDTTFLYVIESRNSFLISDLWFKVKLSIYVKLKVIFDYNLMQFDYNHRPYNFAMQIRLGSLNVTYCVFQGR